MAKSSKSHPTDSDVGVRKSESGVGRLRGFASKPSPPLALSALRPLSRHRNQVGPRLAEKRESNLRKNKQKRSVGVNWYFTLCRRWRHNKSALSFDAEKEGAGCGASVTGWHIGLILRAPCSAAARAIPRRTTCGGFWYFWPQKYIKNFFPCFSMAKSSKSHPTDSDVGVRTSESGVGRLFAGLQANRPRRCRFQPFRPLFRHRNQVGNRLAGKRRRSASLFVLYCRRWRHNNSALSFDTKKEGALPASATKSPASYSGSPTGQKQNTKPRQKFFI